MLEHIGKPGYETISSPNKYVLEFIKKFMEIENNLFIAEIGVGIGSTTLEISKILNNNGELHIFDFNNKVNILKNELNKIGFKNVFSHGNTDKYWDSYHWSIQKLISENCFEKFDLIYIDGAHTYLHDALAFFMCDIILKTGGILVFDDYFWRYSDSKYMIEIRDKYMTDEQLNSCQIKLFIDQLVNRHAGYTSVIKNIAYKKINNYHIKHQD